MADREKVIQAMEWCQENACEGCPYDTHNNESCGISDDILTLLKEQEAVEPKKQIEETEWIVCGNCNKHLIHKWKYCPYCGRSVKWE